MGGLGGQFGIATINNFIGDTASRARASFTSRGRRVMVAAPSVAPVGKGLTKTFALGGATGFLEAFASNGNFGPPPGGFSPFRVQVVVDAVSLLDQTFTENDGLQRILVPYTNGTSGTITFTFTDPAVIFPGGIMVGDVTWWAYDRARTWTDAVIGPNERLVIIGDSWTAFYPATANGVDGVLGTEIKAAMVDAAGTGTVNSVGLSGTTAEYSLSQFDIKVAPLTPTAVLIVDFTNDCNQYGSAGFERWLTAMYKIGQKCQAIGARPIFLVPLPTQSVNQSVSHGIWADELGAGLQR